MTSLSLILSWYTSYSSSLILKFYSKCIQFSTADWFVFTDDVDGSEGSLEVDGWHLTVIIINVEKDRAGNIGGHFQEENSQTCQKLDQHLPKIDYSNRP